MFARFMIICDLLIPIIMIVGGIIMWKHCPKHKNGLVGYRTERSMINMNTWKFANEYCGRLWCEIGLFMIAPSVLVLIPFYRSDDDTLSVVSLVLMTIQCIVLSVSVFLTDTALKKTFQEDGTRR